MPVILLHVLLVVSIVGLLSTSYYPCCGTTLHRKFFSDGPALHFDRYVRKWRTAWKGRRSAGTLFQTADTSVATVHTAYAHCWHYHFFFALVCTPMFHFQFCFLKNHTGWLEEYIGGRDPYHSWNPRRVRVGVKNAHRFGRNTKKSQLQYLSRKTPRHQNKNTPIYTSSFPWSPW